MTKEIPQLVGEQSGNIISELFFNTNGNQYLVDGNKVIFDKNYADNVDINDAVKLSNPKDNFGLMRNGIQLAIETRSGKQNRDSIFYDFKPSQKGNYTLSISGANFNGKYVYLNDNFTKKQTRVDITGSLNYIFDVNENSASAATNRFFLMILEKSVEEIKQLQVVENAFVVYPNPIQDKIIRFELSNNIKTGFNYEIRNEAGQLMQAGSIPPNPISGVYSLKMPENSSSGTYIISVFGIDDGVLSAKFICK
jgi:hypothetical protein